jgi:hypothetical protein
MNQDVEFFARMLAKQKGLNPDTVIALLLHYSAVTLAPKTGTIWPPPNGLMGAKPNTPPTKSMKRKWYLDLEAGVNKLAQLERAFDGDKQKAIAAYVTSEAVVRASGDNWRQHLPKGF